MLADQFNTAVQKAALHLLPDLTQTMWKAVADGHLDWDTAGTLTTLIEARKAILQTKRDTPRTARPLGPARRLTEAWARRRRLAASGPMPPALASSFTTGELAVLRVLADEVRDHGACDRTLGELGGRAGVSVDTARRAVRQATRLGLITVEERRRWRQPSLSNVVRIVSPEWSAWIAKGRAMDRGKGGGWQTCKAKDKQEVRQPSRATSSSRKDHSGTAQERVGTVKKLPREGVGLTRPAPSMHPGRT